jgi:hypothetical protein
MWRRFCALAGFPTIASTDAFTANSPSWSNGSAIAQPRCPIERPAHYTNHPSGIECIQITEHMGFNVGNAFKYIWRADLKGNAIEDLKKARWYLDREISKRLKFTAS